MEAKNTITELKDLLELLVVKESKERVLRDLQNELNSNYDSKFNSLVKFDNNNKAKYISTQIGEKPIYIEPKLKLPNFINRAKEEYQAKLKKYNEEYKKAEIEYYEVFKEARQRLKNEDEFNKNECYSKVKENYSKKEKELKILLNEIEKTKIIPKAYWNRNAISKIVTYFANNRVDTMKEAINMFHEEKRLGEERELAQKHREKIENMIHSQKMHKITDGFL